MEVGYGWLWMVMDGLWIVMVDSDDFFEMLTTLYHIHAVVLWFSTDFYPIYSHIVPYNPF